MTVNDLIQEIKNRIEANPAKVATLKASFQFELSGEGGGTFHAVFDNGTHNIGEGPTEHPGCTVVMAAPDFLALATGKLNPTAAFMSGKLKIKGDMGQAMRLQTILS